MHHKGAFAAFGIPSGAAIPAEENNAVAEVGTFLRRKNSAKLLFYFFRFLAVTQTQTAANADAMGITYHTARCAVEVAQQEIRGFTAHTGDS